MLRAAAKKSDPRVSLVFFLILLLFAVVIYIVVTSLSQPPAELPPEPEEAEIIPQEEPIPDEEPAEPEPEPIVIPPEYEKFIGTVIMIDPGPGGDQFGAEAGGWSEKDIVAPMAEKLRELLIYRGFTVLFTHEEDENVFNEIPEIIASSDAALFVSLHANTFTDESVSGFQVFYDAESNPSRKLASIITEEVKMAGFKTRTYRDEKYYVLSSNEIPSVLVETGFMTNEADLRNLTDEGYRENLMTALAAGILRYTEENILEG